MTDNTEAVEKLAEIYHTARYEQHECPFAAILAAIQADPLAYVKPKPLVWGPMDWDTDDYGCVVWGEFSSGLVSLSECGIYAISEFDVDKFMWTQGDLFNMRYSSYPDRVIPWHPTLEAARAAAETHRNEMLAKELTQ